MTNFPLLYSTAGFRSGKFAARLVKDGVKVKNFKGSIIAWVSFTCQRRLNRSHRTGNQSRLLRCRRKKAILW